MTYPDGIDALVNVNANDTLAAGGHAARHNSVNTALGEVKDFLGTGVGYRYNSAVYFTSNGTFTKATYPWLRAIRVRCQGGGGGGAGSGSDGHAGGGGGGGAYGEVFITDIAGLSASVTVTRGAGGAGGAAGDNNGSAGGQSAFGSYTADGGGGGIHPGSGGRGGQGNQTTANMGIVFGGSSGVNGTNSFSVVQGINGAAGGSSHLGGGGQGAGSLTGTSNDGGAASVYGGGGGGAFRQTANSAGGAGANGIVIVDLFA
jgi:hypothetical protein